MMQLLSSHLKGQIFAKNVLTTIATLLVILTVTSIPVSARAVTIGRHHACNCVIFRLDDIQDEWIDTVQVAVMNHFIAKDEKLTVGAIMNAVGYDTSVIDTIKKGLDSGTFELASHAWNHVDYSKLTPQVQHDTLQQANQKMDDIWGRHAVVFIPPYNAYNEDTLATLKSLNMKIISSEFDLELENIYNPDDPSSDQNKVFKAIPNSDIKDSEGIYHLPQVVGFYTYDTVIPTKTSLKTMENAINKTINSYGYAVVTLHPQDFAIKDSNQEPTNKISSHELADLDGLIQYIHSKGYSTMTYSEALDGSNTQRQDDNDGQDN